jgi:hypothetical protein
MKPNYMIIGAAKCATTTICNHLRQHPDVCLIACKEPHFFSRDEVYARGFDWYESLYDEAGDKKMRGEGSNTYTMKELFPETVSRLVSYAPELKLIYLVRDPISRIESFWLQKRANGREGAHYDFNTAVRVNRHWLVDASNYWQQINAYRPHFPDERIHIIFYEDFTANPDAVMRRCFEFLDVDPDVPLANSNLHMGTTRGKPVARNTLSRLRSVSMFRKAVKLIPESVRNPLKKRLFFRKIEGRPQWDAKNREWVADILEADTRKFLEYYGKPADFWNLRGSESGSKRGSDAVAKTLGV